MNSGLCPGALTFKAEVLAPERPEAACVVIEYGNMVRTSGIQHRFIFYFFPSTLSIQISIVTAKLIENI